MLSLSDYLHAGRSWMMNQSLSFRELWNLAYEHGYLNLAFDLLAWVLTLSEPLSGL